MTRERLKSRKFRRTTTTQHAFKVEKKAQQAKAEAARRVAARKAKAASVRRKPNTEPYKADKKTKKLTRTNASLGEATKR